MIRKIVDVKDPILRAKAKEVGKIDKKIKDLISNMNDTLDAQKDPEGVGLAAPQVGKSLRIFVVSYKELKRVIINPNVLEITKKKLPKTKGKKSNKILEGCLSLPHFYGPIDRASKIKIEYQDINGIKQIEDFRGFNAQIIQHEIDHLNGVLFIDHILKQKAPLYKFGEDGWEEVELT
jgi:peptide deformylase